MTIHDDDAEMLEQARLAAAGDLVPAELAAPEPGTGTVWLMPIHDYWFGTWSHANPDDPEVRMVSTPEGLSRDEAIKWAWDQPASMRAIYDEETDEYIPLDVQAV